ncbi:MAG TPA: M14 family metallopeptidase [Vicinamibacterales bacterium]|nr:M14 family metallopeptidase [Vicinamibacterales bacterium]
MRIPRFLAGPAAAVVGIGLLLATVTGASAPPAVPITFDQFHTTTAVFKYLKDVAAAYPAITELREIGTSTMGRPIYVLVVSNMKTGTTIDALVPLRNPRDEGVKNVARMKPYMGKPGHWIGGSTHGNEYTGTEASLAMIHRLVSGYGSDTAITKIVDGKTFYICPIINPDGHFNSLEKGISQRANSALRDDDGDGKVNEDGPDDLDGDGVIAQFRYKDPKGQYVMDDADPRLMVRLGPNEQTAKTRYAVITEDKDNDGDRKRGEDPEAGIDINRNFPERWWRDDSMPGGTGTYPTSSPEVRAVAEFFHTHPNILMAQFFHTSGGFTYRPLGSAPQTQIAPRDRAVFDFVMGKKYLEIVGEEVPAAWTKPETIPALREELRRTSKNKYAIERGYEFPRAWKVSYDEMADRSYGYGLSTDWDYLQLGIYSLTTELWNPEIDIPGFPKISGGENAAASRQRALLQYNDTQYGGRAFVAWKPFKHPELGEGEIGGWNPKYSSNAWPGEILRGVCDRHVEFELFRAELMPDLAITDASARAVYDDPNATRAAVDATGDTVAVTRGARLGEYRVLEVRAVIENTGPLATHTARGADLRGNRQDVAWLIGDRDAITFLQGTPWQQLGVIDGAMPVPGFSPPAGGRGAPAAAAAAPPQGRGGGRGGGAGATEVRAGGARRTVTWLVAVTGSAPLRVAVSSQKGGTQVAAVKVQ